MPNDTYDLEEHSEEYNDNNVVFDLDDGMDMDMDMGTARASDARDGDEIEEGMDAALNDGIGQSLAVEFGLDLDMEMEMEMDMDMRMGGDLDGELGGVGVGGTLAGELDREFGAMGKMSKRNINSHQTSLTTSPDLADPVTPPNQHLALPDPSPGLSIFSSRGSSPGYSADADGNEHPSFTSTRYYTAYSPGQLSRADGIAASVKGKASFGSMGSHRGGDDGADMDDVSALLGQEDTRDAMRAMLEGKMQTDEMGKGVGLGGVPMPMTPAQRRSNCGTIETPSRYGGPILQRDPMVVIEQCMAETDRFLRMMKDFNAPAMTTKQQTGGVTSRERVANADETNDETRYRAEDEMIADYIHDLTTRERKLDDRQREIERLAEKWEEARYCAGREEVDMIDVHEAISDMMTTIPIPAPPITAHLAALLRDPLPDTLSHLSETLHAQSSLLISTGRQLRAIRQAVQTAQEGLRNEESAIKGIDAWEAERVREGLRGGKRSDALKGLSEGLSELWDEHGGMS